MIIPSYLTVAGARLTVNGRALVVGSRTIGPATWSTSPALGLQPLLKVDVLGFKSERGNATLKLEPPLSRVAIQLAPLMKGDPGPMAGVHEHVQSVASATWVVNHNLGRRPNITVLSVGGVELWAEVVHMSINQAQVIFDSPTAGLAVCS